MFSEVDMPELDRFERTFQPGWRAAYRFAREGAASDEEIADKLAKSLAKTLRENEGVPGFPAMVAAITATDGVSLLEQFSTLDRIVREHGGHRYSKVAAGVAKSFLVQQDAYSRAPAFDDATHQLAISTCEAIVEHRFFANARQHLVTQEKMADQEGARDWQDRVERVNRTAIEKIAGQLIRSPDASGLRAPRGTVKKETTSSLLEEDLLPSRTRLPE